MKELFEKEVMLSEENINQIKYKFLYNIFHIKNQKAIEAAIDYALCLNSIGINNKNYPAFFKILSINNKYIINALLGTHDPFTFMNSLQTNFFIISKCFGLLSKFKPDEINNKFFEVILGYIKTTYNPAIAGYKIYQTTMFDINTISKF